MADQDAVGKNAGDKILDKSPLSGIAVPIAIVLVGALIIFGVTQMLSTDKSYKDLVNEMHSKTFGNRWVAAYELSKHIASTSIPESEIPWLVENLASVYKNTVDPRTRNFIVLASGALKHPAAVPLLIAGLKDESDKVRFNSVVSLGNMPEGTNVPWEEVKSLLEQSSDPGIQQVSIYALSQHRVGSAESLIYSYLSSEAAPVRYSAAIALINFKNSAALPYLEKMVTAEVKTGASGINEAQMAALKLSVVKNISKNKWRKATALLELLKDSKNEKISTKAQEALNILKN